MFITENVTETKNSSSVGDDDSGMLEFLFGDNVDFVDCITQNT